MYISAAKSSNKQQGKRGAVINKWMFMFNDVCGAIASNGRDLK